MPISEYQQAEKTLSRLDPVLAAVIKRYGPCTLKPNKRYFASLCSAIISQQLSVKVAATIEKRFRALLGGAEPQPEMIPLLDDEVLRSAGLSFQKIKYLRSLAEHFDNGHINPRRFRSMSDEQIVELLTEVHGIGRWTAEMFLIFSLGRPDVFSVGDYGLRKAVTLLYGHESHEAILRHSENWKPHRSIASWYLWRSLDNKD